VKGVKISIDPDPVKRNGVVTVTVYLPDGGEPSGWFMRIVSAQDSSTAREARVLEAYVTRSAQGAHECEIRTMGLEPGEYLVDISPMASFEPQDTASKKFSVVPQGVAVATVGRTDPDKEFMRLVRRHGTY